MRHGSGKSTFDQGRRLLILTLGSTAAALAGQAPRSATKKRSAQGPPPHCAVRPEQTEGPYFIDEGLERSDLRVDPSDGSLRPGMPLRLRIHVGKVAGGICTPIPGALVDLWHCDAEGVYSDVKDQGDRFDSRGRKFLRGCQRTGADGNADFLTIYPGWYEGRAVHIHVKVRTKPGARRGHEYTSQLYFDDALTDQVHAQAPYAAKGPRNTRNPADDIFRAGGSQLLLDLAREGEGYAGTFRLGLMFG